MTYRYSILFHSKVGDYITEIPLFILSLWVYTLKGVCESLSPHEYRLTPLLWGPATWSLMYQRDLHIRLGVRLHFLYITHVLRHCVDALRNIIGPLNALNATWAHIFFMTPLFEKEYLGKSRVLHVDFFINYESWFIIINWIIIWTINIQIENLKHKIW